MKDELKRGGGGGCGRKEGFNESKRVSVFLFGCTARLGHRDGEKGSRDRSS